MSELRLDIIDTGRTISGAIHSSLVAAAVAALSAEPETIEELQAAMARFARPVNHDRPFAAFGAAADAERWDAGVVFIDLAAHIVAAESSYSHSIPKAEGR